MSYRIVFDITQAGFKNWAGPTMSFLFVAMGIALVRHHSRGTSWWARHRFALGAFDKGDYSVVEGTVTEFQPETLGNKQERFCVQKRCFKYSDNIITAGFNDSNLWGGPIRMGLPVRVSYVGNTIVKLEVKP